MKRALYTVAAAALVAGTMYAGTAQAAGSCEQNLKEVNAAWKDHPHPPGGGSTTAQQANTMVYLTKDAEKLCAEGKSDHANSHLELVRRWLSMRDFKESN